MDSIIDQVRRIQNEGNNEPNVDSGEKKSFIKPILLTLFFSIIKSIYRSTILWLLLYSLFTRLQYTTLDWFSVVMIYSIYDIFILGYLVENKDKKKN